MDKDQPRGVAEEEGRGGDRRQNDRRRVDRRAPLPPWRRPWALVAYGVLGTLVAVLLFGSRGGETRPAPQAANDAEVVTERHIGVVEEVPAGTERPEAAFRSADYERLVAEGDAARGRRVRVELYCSTINQISLGRAERIESSIAELTDGAGRVPGAECKWGRRRDEVPREDFLVLVPPALAEQFAGAPVVTDGFVRRRRVLAEIEWLGRPEALALRTSGVLREIF